MRPGEFTFCTSTFYLKGYYLLVQYRNHLQLAFCWGINLHTVTLPSTHIKRQLSFQPMNRVTMFLAALSQQNTLWCGLCLQLDLRFNTQRFTSDFGRRRNHLAGGDRNDTPVPGTLRQLGFRQFFHQLRLLLSKVLLFQPRLSSNRIIHTRQSPAVRRHCAIQRGDNVRCGWRGRGGDEGSSGKHDRARGPLIFQNLRHEVPDRRWIVVRPGGQSGQYSKRGYRSTVSVG